VNRLPESLERFGHEYAVAIHRDARAAVRRPRQRRRRALVLATGVVVLALGVWTVQAVAPADRAARLAGPEPASAAERARVALAAPVGTILHVVTDTRAVGADARALAARSETWQDTAPPYGRREVATGAGGRRTEVASVGGRDAFYDAARNTIYVEPEGGAGQPALGVPEPAPAAGGATTGEPLVDQVRLLLDEGRLRETGRAVVDERAAVRLAWDDGHAEYAYLVDAETYAPLEWRIRDRDGATTTIVFRTYEGLERTDGTRALLDLTAQHPGARVVRDAAAYRAAYDRVLGSAAPPPGAG